MQSKSRPRPPAYFYAPASDTIEMPALRRGVPLGDQPTEILGLLDLYPPTPARAVRRTVRQRLRGLVTAADVTGAWRATFWPRVIGSGLITGCTLAVAFGLAR